LVLYLNKGHSQNIIIIRKQNRKKNKDDIHFSTQQSLMQNAAKLGNEGLCASLARASFVNISSKKNLSKVSSILNDDAGKS
jgi:hypothetical protein